MSNSATKVETTIQNWWWRSRPHSRLNAFMFPLGAPGDFPPRSLHRPFWHRGRLAPAHLPRPRSASAAEVHGRFLQGVDPSVSGYPLPPGPRPRQRQLGRRHARGHAPQSPSAGPCRDIGSAIPSVGSPAKHARRVVQRAAKPSRRQGVRQSTYSFRTSLGPLGSCTSVVARSSRVLQGKCITEA
jgi:hypothetical protein